jgi:hypothetical protein
LESTESVARNGVASIRKFSSLNVETHEATDRPTTDAVGKHVEVVDVPLAEGARSRGALEDQRHAPKSTITLRASLDHLVGE